MIAAGNNTRACTRQVGFRARTTSCAMRECTVLHYTIVHVCYTNPYTNHACCTLYYYTRWGSARTRPLAAGWATRWIRCARSIIITITTSIIIATTIIIVNIIVIVVTIIEGARALPVRAPEGPPLLQNEGDRGACRE